MYNSKTVKVLQSLHKFEIIALLALYHESRAKEGTEKICIDSVQDRANAISNQLSLLSA
jgi:hypothetical protein